MKMEEEIKELSHKESKEEKIAPYSIMASFYNKRLF